MMDNERNEREAAFGTMDEKIIVLGNVDHLALMAGLKREKDRLNNRRRKVWDRLSAERDMKKRSKLIRKWGALDAESDGMAALYSRIIGAKKITIETY